MTTTQHTLPFTVSGAVPAELSDIAPWQMTTHRIADTDAGGLGAPGISKGLTRFLEPETPPVPWWEYPGARAWLALQPRMTAIKLEALAELAGRTDDVSLKEVAQRFHVSPAKLLAWHLDINQLMCRFLGRVMEDMSLPQKSGPTVQALRERLALSIQSLAARAGVASSTVFRAVHGLPLQPSSKQRLAHALQVRPEHIKWEHTS